MNELLKFAAGCALGYATVYVLTNGIKPGFLKSLKPGNPKNNVAPLPPGQFQFPAPKVA